MVGLSCRQLVVAVRHPRLSTTDRDTGTLTEIWRAPTPVSAGARLYGRVRVVVP